MKKTSITSFLAIVIIAFGTGCLKDSGFENGEYGLNVKDIKAVSFPNAGQSPLSGSFAFIDASQEVAGLLAVNLETEGFATTSDVTVTVDNTTGTDASGDIKKYNDDDTLNILPDVLVLPPAVYSLPANVVIPTGKKFSEIPITITNAKSLDIDKAYGVGLTISAATNGYQVAKNMSKVLIIFKINNIYHGVYDAVGYLYHPSVPRKIEEEKMVSTASPNSVTVTLGDLGGSGYVALLTIDPTTNKVRVSAAPNSPSAPYTQFDAALPPPYTAAWTGSSQCTNIYDPATKTFKLRYGYMGGTGWRVTEEFITLK